jgi:hypothetical protein
MSDGMYREGTVTLPEHLSSPPGFRAVRVARSSVFRVMFCRTVFVLMSFYLLVIMEHIRGAIQ